MQSVTSDAQVLGGYGGYGMDGMNGMNGLPIWLLLFASLGRNGGLFGNDNNAVGSAAVANTTGIAENSAKIDCLAQGQDFINNTITRNSLNDALRDVNTYINTLAGIERDQTTLLAGITRDLQDTIFRESNAQQRQLAECCCELKKGQSDIQTAIALQTNTIVSNDNANTQKILDKLCDNEISALRSQNDNLQRQLATAEIVAACGGRGPGSSSSVGLPI